MSYLQENLSEIQENIARAAEKSNRRPEDITLVAVTKTVPLDRIQEAFNLGVTNFGENRVQEFLTKYEYFKQDHFKQDHPEQNTCNQNVNLTGPNSSPTWHMIGHLQTNKVRQIVEKVALIHSVDSLRLAEEIDKRAKGHNLKVDILIEINIAEEDTKQGIKPKETAFLIEQIQHLPNICTKGLMCIAPYVEDSEQNRIYFEKMKRLFIDIQGKCLHNVDMRFLSMGMTGDYQVAIEEGANIVRVGTGLFGSR